MHPPLLNINDIAIFLDFDGTLVDFARSPDAVHVSSDLKHLLSELNRRSQGALALITGRSLESLDSLLDSPSLCAAGCHGAEWRVQPGEMNAAELGGESLHGARIALRTFADSHNLLLEEKPHSLALHFRNRPTLQDDIDAWIAEQLAEFSDLRVINGKLVREIQVVGIHKGVAVERFMQHAPFAGRLPVYVGDDVTDEDAFAWVNGAKGVAVKVGSGDTVAPYQLPDFRAVHNWLEELAVNADH
jgi:trehalose 6-phosphate phosphatase